MAVGRNKYMPRVNSDCSCVSKNVKSVFLKLIQGEGIFLQKNFKFSIHNKSKKAYQIKLTKEIRLCATGN